MWGIPQALTGPIARGDLGTIRKHLSTMEEVEPGLTDCTAAGPANGGSSRPQGNHQQEQLNDFSPSYQTHSQLRSDAGWRE
jgi:predicted short-subunit dehydrogenase-like oxidoreductase (DUF2520 family)